MAKLIVFEVTEVADLKKEATQRRSRTGDTEVPKASTKTSRFRELLESVALQDPLRSRELQG